MTIPEAIAHLHKHELNNATYGLLCDFIRDMDECISHCITHDDAVHAWLLSGAGQMARGPFLESLEAYWNKHAKPKPEPEWRELAGRSTWGPESYIVEIFPREAEVALLLSPLGDTPQKFRITARCGAKLRVEERTTPTGGES